VTANPAQRGIAAWITLVAALLAIAIVPLRLVDIGYRISRAVDWGILHPVLSAAGLLLMGLGAAAAVLLVRRTRVGKAGLATTFGALLALSLTLVGSLMLPEGLAFYPGPVPGIGG
jgi:hypothetical protein